MHLGLRARKWCRAISSRAMRARRTQHDGRHAAGEQQGQRDRSSPATGEAGQRRVFEPFESLRGSHQHEGETDPHHGQKQLTHQKRACRGKGCLDHAQPPATAPGAQAVEQRQMPNRRPRNPRSRVQAQARCPLRRHIAGQGPRQRCNDRRHRGCPEPSCKPEHPRTAPHKVREVLPGDHRANPIWAHQQEQPVGRIENAIERIRRNGEAEALVGIPRR